MSKLTTKQRNALPKSDFALPGGRYPMPDKSHAVNAKARATQQYKAGNLSASQKATIDRKADAKLKGEPMKKMNDAPKKMLSQDSGEKAKASIPQMPHMNKAGFETQKMSEKTAMGGAHKLGSGFDNHEKCCG